MYGNGDQEDAFNAKQGKRDGHSLVKVNVYFKHLNVKKISEDPEYSVSLEYKNIIIFVLDKGN